MLIISVSALKSFFFLDKNTNKNIKRNRRNSLYLKFSDRLFEKKSYYLNFNVNTRIDFNSLKYCSYILRVTKESLNFTVVNRLTKNIIMLLRHLNS